MIETRVDTKQKILDTAEKLFSENGIEATSLRTIVSGANVNLAAIHYHFRSKEGLIEAIVVRRTASVNRERLAMLDAVEEAAGAGQPSVEKILEAFMLPVAHIASDPSRGGTAFVRLMARLLVESNDVMAQILHRHFAEVARRFMAALHRAAPHLPPEDLFWRMYFSTGAMAQAFRGGKEVEALSEGRCKTGDLETIARRLIAFLAPGFHAPATEFPHD
jgi:AcrR family transcriptional regulator